MAEAQAPQEQSAAAPRRRLWPIRNGLRRALRRLTSESPGRGEFLSHEGRCACDGITRGAFLLAVAARVALFLMGFLLRWHVSGELCRGRVAKGVLPLGGTLNTTKRLLSYFYYPTTP